MPLLDPGTRLFILRHAHSARAELGQRDHQRSLDDRGRQQATWLGDWFEAHGPELDAVFCSSAVRTRETLDLVRPRLSNGRAVSFSDSLYALGPDAYYEAVRRAGDAGAVMIVGHNPTISDFARSLAGTGEETAMATMGDSMPTCGLAVVELSGEANGIQAGQGYLRAFVSPIENKP